MEASRELYIALANIKMNPEDNVDFEHALTLLEQRRFLEAIEAFPDVVAIAPELTGAYGNRGLAYLNLGLEEEAIRDFERVLELDPEDAMGYAMLAEISRFRGAPEETLRLVVELSSKLWNWIKTSRNRIIYEGGFLPKQANTRKLPKIWRVSWS